MARQPRATTTTTTTTQVATTAASTSSGTMIGVNIAGGEFGQVGQAYGYGYIYPSHSEIDYYASKHMDIIRVPFLWERVQKSKFGGLDSTEIRRLDDVVNYATSKGLKVAVDMHNYGYAFGSQIGSAGAPNAAYADVWGKLAGHWQGNGNVLFGIMNEPHDQNASTWINSINAAVSAIRNAGAHKQTILVPGTYWDGAHSWVATDNDTVIGKGVRDPDNKYAFEVHQYFDWDSSGTSTNVVSPTIGADRLKAITKWATDNHQKLFLGEFGAGKDGTSLTALDNMLKYVSQHQDVWMGGTYWAGGAWWGDYGFSVEPQNGADAPQMSLLKQYSDIMV